LVSVVVVVVHDVIVVVIVVVTVTHFNVPGVAWNHFDMRSPPDIRGYFPTLRNSELRV